MRDQYNIDTCLSLVSDLISSIEGKGFLIKFLVVFNKSHEHTHKQSIQRDTMLPTFDIKMLIFNCSRASNALESNSQHLINRRTANYGQDTAGPDNTVDLHNKEFCVDVSTYEPVVWKEVDAEQCDTVFVKKCEDRSEEVCADVTETRCQVKHPDKLINSWKNYI